MTLDLKTVLELLAVCGALWAFVKACWSVAEFAISAKTDIKTLAVTVTALTSTVEKLEVSLDNGMIELRTRLLALETKEAIRVATEHIHDMENR